MADEERLIPAGIRDDRSLAFAGLAARLGALPTEQLLIYLIDLVNVTALPHLGEQFSVLGYNGWLLTSTDDERRALIKKAFELHRYKGTPWAIKQAIRACGFPDVTITTRPPKRYRDGSIIRDRSEFHGTPVGQWALFRVYIDLAESKGIVGGVGDLVRGSINAYKPARSWLQHFGFRNTNLDDLTVTEQLALTVNHAPIDTLLDAEAGDPLAATIRYRTRHNGLRTHNGATFHGATFEEAI